MAKGIILDTKEGIVDMEEEVLGKAVVSSRRDISSLREGSNIHNNIRSRAISSAAPVPTVSVMSAATATTAVENSGTCATTMTSGTDARII